MICRCTLVVTYDYYYVKKKKNSGPAPGNIGRLIEVVAVVVVAVVERYRYKCND